MKRAQNKQAGFSAVEVVIVVAVIGALVGIGFLVKNRMATTKSVSKTTVSTTTKPVTDPTELFNLALANTLSTKSGEVRQTQDNNVMDAKFIVTDMKNPTINLTGHLDILGAAFDVQGYGSMKNTYIKYTNLPAEVAASPVANKWIQLRTNGAIDESFDKSFPALVDPRALLFGETIIGNFTAAQRTELLAFFKQSPVYTFDAATVKPATVNGKTVKQYSVTINTDNLKKYNEKVAGYLGLTNDSYYKYTVQDLGTVPKTTMYIDPATQQIVEVDLASGVKTQFLNQGNATVTAEPKADMTAAQANAAFTTATGSPLF